MTFEETAKAFHSKFGSSEHIFPDLIAQLCGQSKQWRFLLVAVEATII
jgi:hypothetical protein